MIKVLLIYVYFRCFFNLNNKILTDIIQEIMRIIYFHFSFDVYQINKFTGSRFYGIFRYKNVCT